MSKPEYTWPVRLNISARHKPKTKTVMFGGSYQQRQSHGMHADLPSYQITSSLPRQEAVQARAFLKARGAVESFLWTPPDEAQGLFICETWSFRTKGPQTDITATFKQVIA